MTSCPHFFHRKILTFGTKTRQRVPVVQKMIKTAMMIKDAFWSSLSTKLMAAPSTHMITTLYTDMPTYLLSFNAGICTFRVSHAKKAPKA